MEETMVLRLLLFTCFFWSTIKITSWGYGFNILAIVVFFWFQLSPSIRILKFILIDLLPILSINTVLYAVITPVSGNKGPRKYQMKPPLKHGRIRLENIRRGVSIIGAAGSGKTESVVYQFLRHFQKYGFCGLIHDYKNFELTEMAYPLFKDSDIPFYIVSFDPVHHRVNPISPRYLPDEESVNEVSRVLLENLLEQKEGISSGATRFFNDAVEGLISGLIWKLRSEYPNYCTLPHLIALYQYLDNKSLIHFLSSNLSSKAMADAFISGIDSERQTAAVRSTLANALKKMSTRRIFMALSSDEVPLDINNPINPAVVCVVNNPKYESAYSPALATLIHCMVKQMSIRDRQASFVLMEEAPTLRLLNMHRIPATLRSYNISTVYVMQDKIQNDLLYGEKASRAILSNLSYQFFGKVNDPETARYYERFFEIIKRKSISTNHSLSLRFDTRITRSERETAKIRADRFFRLAPGEFVCFADGKDTLIKFHPHKIQKRLPEKFKYYSQSEIDQNFNRIHREVKSIFHGESHQ